ncbi:MAG: phage protein Gp36 family protein [Phocaeicola sp.]
MYVTESDYVAMSDGALQVLQQNNEQRRNEAEKAAAEEVYSYLGSRYDLEKEYSLLENERNAKLVQVFCNIVLYFLGSNTKAGRDLRKEQYEAAIKWLNLVQNKPINLPLLVDESGKESSNPIVYGSNPPLNHSW